MWVLIFAKCWAVARSGCSGAFDATERKCNYLTQGLENLLSWSDVIKTLCLATDHVNIFTESLSSYAGDASPDRYCLLLKCQPCNSDALARLL